MLTLDYLGGPSVITIVLKRVKGRDMKKDAEIGNCWKVTRSQRTWWPLEAKKARKWILP